MMAAPAGLREAGTLTDVWGREPGPGRSYANSSGGSLICHWRGAPVDHTQLARKTSSAAPSSVPAESPSVRGGGLIDWAQVEAHLGVKFKDPLLLRQALVHTSYLNENPGIGVGSNERLEFLGDAVLGLVVARQLYKQYPEAHEGRLTELRAHLVRRETLARAAARLGLGDVLLLGRGEGAAGGRRRPTNLAHAYEALVGAIFLDRGLAQAQRFVMSSLKEDLLAIRGQEVAPDSKSRLQEVVQSRWQTTPSYRTTKIEGPDHARRFTVQVSVGSRQLGEGQGRSKQAAEKQAAEEALRVLAEGEE